MMVPTIWTGEWPRRGYDLVLALGDVRAAAATIGKEMGKTVSEPSLRSMLRQHFPDWQKKIARQPGEATAPESVLRDRVKALEAELDDLRRGALTDERIKRDVLRMAAVSPSVPSWLVKPTGKPTKSPGVPTLFVSDWHWGERVDPAQIGGVNSYSLETARERARALVTNAIDLLKNHMVRPDYPGLVLAVGGDMFSGDIHEELSVSNEAEIMPCVTDLFGVMIWVIETLASEFGRVFVPWVSGNHPRTTLKIRAKGRAFTSFDWLLGQFLTKHFSGDKRIQFLVPDGPDALYRVYGHRYLLTHGDQFRGGDGMIGALGPIIRGDHKKRSRNSQIDQGYDTLVLGHWHQLIQMQRLIVNGSLKGYDEYAFAGNFPFEPPRQALWLTHPEHGITLSMPVLAERKRGAISTSWVQWAA